MVRLSLSATKNVWHAKDPTVFTETSVVVQHNGAKLLMKYKSKRHDLQECGRHDVLFTYSKPKVSMTSLCLTAAPDCGNCQSRCRYREWEHSIPIVVVGTSVALSYWSLAFYSKIFLYSKTWLALAWWPIFAPFAYGRVQEVFRIANI